MSKMSDLRHCILEAFSYFKDGEYFHWDEIERIIDDKMWEHDVNYKPHTDTTKREFRRLRQKRHIYYENIKPTKLSLYRKLKPNLFTRRR